MRKKKCEHEIYNSKFSESNFFYFSLCLQNNNLQRTFSSEDIELYYNDLKDPKLVTRLALVHQRFSYNTFPTWDLAQPFRYMCHNGEINTIKGI